MIAPRYSFARRLFLSVVPIALAGITALGTLAYFIAKKHMLTNVQKEIQALSQHAGLSLSAFFKQRLNDLETVSETPLLMDYHNNLDFGLLTEAETYRREIGAYILRFSQRTGGIYHRILFIDQVGREICRVESSQISLQRTPFPDPALLLAVRRLPASQHYESRVQAKQDGLSLLYAKPIYNLRGEFKGLAVLECDLRPVQQMLEQINPSGWAYLTDETGRFLMGTPAPASPSGKDLLVRHAPVPGSRWSVTLGISMSHFLKPLEQIKVLTLLLGLLCGAIVMLLIYFMVRKLTQPVQKLVQTTKNLELGNLSSRVEIASQDEIGILSKYFNKMAESLEERTRDLEARIQQLTALQDMEETVNKRLDEETILKTCLATVARGFSFDRTALYWVDPLRKEIRGRHLYGTESMGFMEDSFRKRWVPMDGNDILCNVVRTRAPVLVNDLEHDPRLNPDFMRESKTREFVMAPICGKDRVFGVLAADNYYTRRPLRNSDLDGLSLFANAMGLALENADLLQNLAESEARYRAVLENSPVAVLGLSREQRITTWNRGAEQIFGYRSSEMIGKPVTILFPLNSDSEFNHLMNQLMVQGAVRDHAITGVSKERKRLDLSLSWGGAYHDFWMNKEWTVVIRDATEAKKLQQKMIDSEKLSAAGQLISCIAHELNNPLQAVIGYAELLTKDTWTGREKGRKRKSRAADEIELREDLGRICDNATRCRKIIDNLLLFVRHSEVRRGTVSIRTAVQTALELLEYKLRKSANIRTEIDIPSDLPPVQADLQQVQQVFVNLINNACDAMMEWRGAKNLKIRAAESGGTVRVEVIDSGPGMSPEIQKRLFEPFFTTKPEGRGTGLGLTVCQQILQEHGGLLGFESELHKGTTFWLQLPAAREEAAVPKAARAVPAPVPGKAVLLIDDEPDVLSYLLKLIHADGDRGEAADCFEEAVRRIKHKRYDLIVTDIRLGDGTGLDLYDHWQQWTQRPRPPIIVLTGDVFHATLSQAAEKRGLTLLHKPVDLETFQKSFRTLLSSPKVQS